MAAVRGGGSKDLEERDGPGDSSTRAVLDAILLEILEGDSQLKLTVEELTAKRRIKRRDQKIQKLKLKQVTIKDSEKEKTNQTIGLQMSKRLLKMNVLLHQMKNLIQRRLMMRLGSSLDKISEEDDQAKVLSNLEISGVKFCSNWVLYGSKGPVGEGSRPGAETGTYERYEHTPPHIQHQYSRKLIMKGYNDESKNFVEQEEEEGRSRKAHSQILRKTRARAGGGVLLRLWHIPKYGGNGSSLWIRVRVFNLIFKTAKSPAGLEGGIGQGICRLSELSRAIDRAGEVSTHEGYGYGPRRLMLAQSGDGCCAAAEDREGFKGLEQDKDSTRIKGQKSRGYRIKSIEDYKKKKKEQDREAENRGVRNKRIVRRKALV
ncbi:hypothetical protein PPACK8108_LOCUS13756 [Phakopsora pachyrhizi]|uniref:Uncharacterized protein n=1 Tax=Phakopsora pachyrhizi TaxID=170000 RepID=A0AAV0B737_PHAPC|nr:hypothetical protein PPACK8108_LOCUS13756 [Phakopsora pachyrhizi]